MRTIELNGVEYEILPEIKEINQKTSATITGFTGKVRVYDELYLPAKVEGIPVRGIRFTKDSKRVMINKLVIRSAEFIIGKGFSGVGLKELVLPKNLKVIGAGVFEYNRFGLKSNKTLNLTGVREIGEFAFNKFTNISQHNKLTIKLGECEIGDGAFQDGNIIVTVDGRILNLNYKLMGGLICAN